MVSMLRAMQKKNSGISPQVLPLFEGIVEAHQEKFGPHLVGFTSFHPQWDDDFSQALKDHLTQAQRFKLYQTQGACNGAGADKARKTFAKDYAHLPLAQRIPLFAKTFDRWEPVLNPDNTLTLTFKCGHGYYKRAREGKYNAGPPPNVEFYFERCAGGRLYELEKALGIKLQIKSVDVSPLAENVENPVVFVFEIVE